MVASKAKSSGTEHLHSRERMGGSGRQGSEWGAESPSVDPGPHQLCDWELKDTGSVSLSLRVLMKTK